MVPFPSFTRDDYLKQTAEDMYSLLTASPALPSGHSSPSLFFGPLVLNALSRIADIL